MTIQPADLKSAPDCYSDDCPKVSIVILNFNKAQLTVECLKSIWEYTNCYSYEIIVVDNGSQADEFQILSAFHGPYKLLRLEINRYFGEGNNIGAELAKGEFIVFMNNDITVRPNWLPSLMEAFYIHSDCGAAGPKFIYPNGKLQEAGALLDSEGGSVQIGKFQDPDTARFNVGRVVDYVSAATVLIRKKIFEDVLGFDFMYEPAYYEDVDLCLKIGQLGLKTYYVPESCVVHHENATTADPKNKSLIGNIVAVNRDKFVRRWDAYLKTGTHHAATTIPLLSSSVTPSSQKPTAAIFTPYNIIPGGGESYLLSTVEAFIRSGYQVYLITPEQFSYLRITKIAEVLGLNIQGLTLVTLAEAEKMPSFNLFFAIGNEIAAPVQALGQRNFYCCQFPFPCRQEEIHRRSAWMSDYEAYIVYSDFVKLNLIKQVQLSALPNLAVHIVSPPVNPISVRSNLPRKGIISVGRFFTGGHCKQHDMLIRAFRKLHDSGVHSELHLVGSLHPEPQHRKYFMECQSLAQGLPVHFHVDASPETLARLYAESSIYWHGAGFGVDLISEPERCEHFGISIIEAMSAGVIPVVVNNGGPAVTVQDHWNGYIYNSEDNLIDITRSILSQPEIYLEEMRAHAKMRAADFSKESFYSIWKQLLK